MSEAVLATETNRSQLQQIIAGLSDGVILIETDKARTLLWANQAALAMHGVSGVEELGANVREYARRYALRYRNNHSLALASYPINRVAAGEIFSDVVVQVQARIDGEPRRWVHRVRSMILNDRSGQPESLVLILSDASDWASAEQRFERTFSANPAPAVICRLSDLRYIKVNPGFLEMTGYARDQVIGRSVYQLDVLEGAEHKDLAIERLGQGGTIPQMQAELRLPEGGSKLVIVAGQPLDINDEDCMLFSFMDLEPRRRVEIALRHSEERFAKSFRLNPVPTLVCSAEQQILDVNEAFIDSCGYSSEELLGRTLSETACLAADGAAALLFGQLEKLGKVSGLDLQVRKKGGELMDCVAYADTLVLEDRPCYLLVLMDISQRKRSELELVEAIEEVMRDASWFSRTLIEKLANVRNTRSAVASGVTSADLTAREREVLGLIYQGLADKEIAARLKLAPNTVRNHVATLYSKLDVHSRGEAIVWARERGLFAGSAG